MIGSEQTLSEVDMCCVSSVDEWSLSLFIAAATVVIQQQSCEQRSRCQQQQQQSRSEDARSDLGLPLRSDDSTVNVALL